MRISQREARRLRQRVGELEREREGQRSAWCGEYPGGTHIASVVAGGSQADVIRTARKLRHAVVCTVRDSGEILFHALPVGKA